MSAESLILAQRIFDALAHGSDGQRNRWRGRLGELDAEGRGRLCRLISRAVSAEFAPNLEYPHEDRYLERAWLMSTLARIAGETGETIEFVEGHLDPEREPRPWVRYWTLEGLVASGHPRLETIAQMVARSDPDQLPQTLGFAVLASERDRPSLEHLTQLLKDESEQRAMRQWYALRALQIVPIRSTVPTIVNIVRRGTSSRLDEVTEVTFETYAAVVSLGSASAEWHESQDAGRALANILAETRAHPNWAHLRVRAIAGLGNLRARSAAPILLEELLDDNPAIVRESARALEKALGPGTAVQRIVETLAADSWEQMTVEYYARALRWMDDRTTVVEELEAILQSGRGTEGEIARALLTEVGGVAAFQKLRAQRDALAKYTDQLETAESRVRVLFDESISDARQGFRLATRMDVAVFVMGLGLLVGSALVALVADRSLGGWIGVGTTASAGVAGTLYSLFVANPRKRVEEVVDHLMHVKVVFLGYLRQLHQADQAFTRRMLEDRYMEPREVTQYSGMVARQMEEAVLRLSLSGGDRADGERPKTNGRPSRAKRARVIRKLPTG